MKHDDNSVVEMPDTAARQSERLNSLKNGSPCSELGHDLHMEGMVLINDPSVFLLGEDFESFEDLTARLSVHSKESLIHYWRRDSRTVQGALYKTSRYIEPRLKYYTVRYACVHGGPRHVSHSKGQRNKLSMRCECPAHILVRVNRAGTRLEVVSVCNHHNHPVTYEVYLRRPQQRRLPPQVKEEMMDFLHIGVDRKRIVDYVLSVTGIHLTNKDLLNSYAVVKRGMIPPTPQRIAYLYDMLNKLEELEPGADIETSIKKSGCLKIEGPRNGVKQKKVKKLKKAKYRKQIIKKEEPDPINGIQVVSDDCEMGLQNYLVEPQDEASCHVGGEIEIDYREDFDDKVDDSNIFKYFYPSEPGEEEVVTILNEDENFVSYQTSDDPVQYDLVSSEPSVDTQLIPEQVTNDVTLRIVSLCTLQDLQNLNSLQGDLSPVETFSSHILNDNSQDLKEILVEACETITDNCNLVEDEQAKSNIANNNENDSETVDCITKDFSVQCELNANCSNCEILKDADSIVRTLRFEKDVLLKEVEALRQERDSIIEDVMRGRSPARYQLVGDEGVAHWEDCTQMIELVDS